MIKWKDATSYSKSKRKGESEPTSWETEIHGVRILISCSHIYYTDKWVMNCSDLFKSTRYIGDSADMTHDHAKAVALAMVAVKAGQTGHTMQQVVDTILKQKIQSS